MTNEQIIAQLKNMPVETAEARNARLDAENKASAERFARHCTLATLENGAGEIVRFRNYGAGYERNLADATAKFQKALREANTRFEGMTESKKYAKAAAQAAELGITF